MEADWSRLAVGGKRPRPPEAPRPVRRGDASQASVPTCSFAPIDRSDRRAAVPADGFAQDDKHRSQGGGRLLTPPGMRDGTPSPGRSYIRECMNFNGHDQFVEREVSEIGGNNGLTVMARVKRGTGVGPDWDRLIDFGNGAERENIVINFQQEMMYEVRGEDGENQVLCVADTSSSSSSVGEQLSERWKDSTTQRANDSSFPKDKWVHISLVHDRDGTASIFWDGHLKAQGRLHLPKRVKRDKFYVGRSHWRHDPYFKGEISELHVFDYALRPAEVSRCARERAFPIGFRGKPILSLADAWREVGVPLRAPPLRCSPADWVAAAAAAAAATTDTVALLPIGGDLIDGA